ncbi:MAG: tetratricopeptide repeat protein [Candidatus Viridilinea halotolerans]|uniref:Tetratricopeptide repeat protein n=1 Tax=Candidatus Viridilinea halotolerans TaxID=2491704 RepID=A0A426U7I8_9CHLR|nr:MAG: tetratricopeptide repeat protein [Candidatus Viridilinea halotolerans]
MAPKESPLPAGAWGHGPQRIPPPGGGLGAWPPRNQETMVSATNHQLIQTLVSYLPPAIVREIAVEQRVYDQPRARTFWAALLLTDISGFTGLTEKLAMSGPDGAEELTAILNRYFSRMISLLDAEGGEVVQFSGDALIATFPAATPDVLPGRVQAAWQAASAMQAAMAEFAMLQTSGGVVSLGMKLIIGAGEVTGLSVGGKFRRWQYVLAGDPLRQVAEGEKRAQRGALLLSPEAQALWPQQPRAPQPLCLPTWDGPNEATLAALQSHIPGAITHRLIAGQDTWLSELRTMSVLFLGIGGLAIQGAESLAQAQACMVAFQETIYHHEGSLNKLLVDDKGVIALVLFGAPPLAHYDDAVRAVRCACDLQRVAAQLTLELAIGVTTGLLFAGSVGSPSRREYTVIGDVVNLAARLMQTAGRGHVLADHATYSATRAELEWEELAPQTVKGRVTPVRVYRPRARHGLHAVRSQRPPMVGRSGERSQLAACLAQLQAGASLQVTIHGAAGLGKTRLLHEFLQMAQAAGVACLMGASEVIEQQTCYQGWREIFTALFDLELARTRAERQAAVLASLREAAATQSDDLLERAPLLNDLLDLGLAETSLTATLAPQLRQASLAALLLTLLGQCAQRQPLVLIFEDAHWLDSLAWDLLLQAARGLRGQPVLLLITMRPLEDLAAEHPLHQLQALPGSQALALKPLSSHETTQLARTKLQQAQLDPQVEHIFQSHTSGNPFVIEEVALSLLETGAVTIQDGICTLNADLETIRLPSSIQGLVLSRIDRLPANQQLVVKLASVIGRSFGNTLLHAVYPTNLPAETLASYLDALQQQDLVLPLDTLNAIFSHSFRQIILQEVVYGTLLSSQRRQLHRQVALWYEEQQALHAELEAILAYHWRRAGDVERELHYTLLQGRTLATSYANREALVALGRALELTEEAAVRYELLWLRSQIHERMGQRAEREADLHALQRLADDHGSASQRAQVANAWAAFYRDTSAYPQALGAIERALHIAEVAHLPEEAARSLTLHGQVLEYTGNFAGAKDCFAQALERYRQLDQRRGEADNLSHLGNVARYQSAYQGAYDYYGAALALRQQLGDKAGEVVSLNNRAQMALVLGNMQEALGYQQQALALAHAIGDRNGEALLLGTMGNTALLRGDYSAALPALEQCVRLCQAIGERRREASALNQLGMVWRDLGNRTAAREALEQALAIQGAIGDQSQAAYTCLNLGYVLLPAWDAAEALYLRALHLGQQAGARDVEAYSLSYRAHLALAQTAWSTATAHYNAALEHWHALGMATAAMEDRAALAFVKLQTGDAEAAFALAHAVASHLQQHGADGLEFPWRTYRYCHDVLQASGAAERAQQLLQSAHALLLERAAAIEDAELRAAFLRAAGIGESR